MVYDEDWDPAAYAPEAADKGHGEAWERLNNQLFLEWQRFNARLEAHAEQRENDRKPLSAAERAVHVGRFRDLLHERYGRSAVDARWEAERAKRLDERDQPTRGGRHAA
jgi:hypothetical protein